MAIPERKRKKIEPGDEVKWWVPVMAGLPYKAGLDAEVVSVDEESQSAVVRVRSDVTITAKWVEFSVLLESLENKTYDRDSEREWSRAIVLANLESAATVPELECADGFLDPFAEEYWYETIDDYIESTADKWDGDDPVQFSDYLWAAKPRYVPRVSADAIEERIAEYMGEDWHGSINGLVDLQLALDKFYEANPGLYLLYPDHDRKVSTLAAQEEWRS